MSSATPIQPASEPPPSLAPREWRLRLDPLLLLAVLGLVVCSLVALKGATAGDVDGQPYYYVYRQAVYAGVGLVLMYALSRFDYTRLQELRYAVYGLLIALLLVVLAVATATRGAKAWIDIPVFGAFQPSEFGKVLLVVALAAFLVSRMRLMGRQTTARIVLLGLIPTMLVMAENDLGSALVYGIGILAVLFVAGAPWRHFAALGTLFAVAGAIVLVAAPALGVEVLKPYQKDRLTSFLEPSADPADAGLPAAAVQDRHRLRREDRPRGGQRHPDGPGLPARAPHRLHLRRGRRDLRVRRLRTRLIALRAAHMARAPHPDRREEPLRGPAGRAASR